MTVAIKKSKITKKELFRAYNKWYWLCEVSHYYDRLQSLSFRASIQSTLRKLYPDDEEYQEVLLRRLQFFSMEGTTGSMVHGITMSLEEEKAASKEVFGEMIIALKIRLMGPAARVEDTLIWGTLKPICLAFTITMTLNNNLVGAFFVLLFPLAGYFIGYYMCHLGCSLDRNAISRLIQSGLMSRIIDACSILGLVMTGALSTSFVSLATTASFKLENSNPILLQNVLNGIMPGLLPFTVITGIYFYMKEKSTKYGGILAGIIIASLVLSFFDIA